jgi:hypothetical protein
MDGRQPQPANGITATLPRGDRTIEVARDLEQLRKRVAARVIIYRCNVR